MIRLVILVVILYIYFHNPVLSISGGIGLCKMLYPLALFYLIAYGPNKLRLQYKSEIAILELLFLFILFRTLCEGDPIIVYTTIIMLIECYLIPMLFSNYWYKWGLSFSNYITYVLLVSALASIITTACIVIPSFGYYVRFTLQEVGSTDFLLENYYRGYGISDSLVSAYGYIQGACFAIGYKYRKANRWFLYFMPFVFVSVFINARTGAIVAAIGIIIELYQNHNYKTVLSTLFVAALFVGLTPYFMKFYNFSDETLIFFNDFIEQIDGTREDSAISALNDGFKWPRDIFEWILGRGEDIFYLSSGMRSDIGYSIQLNYGGVVYILILFCLWRKLVKNMLLVDFDRFIPFFILSTILVLNYKCNMMVNNGYLRFVLLAYFMFVGNKINSIATNQNN